MSAEPFAYAIQAPIGSVVPLFHRFKDAEAYIAKLTDSRDEAKIIPLYREPIDWAFLNDEIARLRLTAAEREAVEWFAEVRKPLTRLTQRHNREKYKDTLRGLLERLGGGR